MSDVLFLISLGVLGFLMLLAIGTGVVDTSQRKRHCNSQGLIPASVNEGYVCVNPKSIIYDQ